MTKTGPKRTTKVKNENKEVVTYGNDNYKQEFRQSRSRSNKDIKKVRKVPKIESQRLKDRNSPYRKSTTSRGTRVNSLKRDASSSKKKSNSRNVSLKRKRKNSEENSYDEVEDYEAASKSDEVDKEYLTNEEDDLEAEEIKSTISERGKSYATRRSKGVSNDRKSKSKGRGKSQYKDSYNDEEEDLRNNTGRPMDVEYAQEDYFSENRLKKSKREIGISKDSFFLDNSKNYHTMKIKPKNIRKGGVIKKKSKQYVPINIFTEIELRDQGKGNFGAKNELDEALQRLQENYEPAKILCREKEKKVIEDFIESGLQNRGNSQTLCKVVFNQDISGVPGIGKTACVVEIINGLRKKHSNFLFISLNGLKIPKPSAIYSQLFYSIFDQHINPESACKALGNFF